MTIVNNTAYIKVTACDRNGRVLQQVEIHKKYWNAAESDKRIAFDKLRKKYPDAQVYYDRADRSKLEFTEGVSV